jgi:CheY-like chemotaxis protein
MREVKDKQTILLAENNQIFRSLAQEFLENAGYLIVICTNPYEARQVLLTQAVDLAILDVRLLNDNDDRDRTGLRIAREVAPHVPKIILTVIDNTIDVVREALKPDMNGKSPAVDYISKQVGLEVLLTAVRGVLSVTAPPPTSQMLVIHTSKVHPVLLQCGPFKSDAQLKAVFVDSRIQPWQNQLPDANDESDRVSMTINYLYNKKNKSGEDALLLFLAVLCDRVSPETECHQLLAELIDELKGGLP